ncbi:MAG: GDP-L-fucose synthase [Flavobacteriaceae bacterium TMED238]|nr:GDP-L-fucose synthase [Pelagibacterales bacterium]RPG63218.1 MAG: GDP-L-fucose synthase [Flavobacteriaceae bacterium TMED238]
MKVLILGSGGLVGSSLKKILDKNESIKKVICSTREDTNLFDFEETKRLIENNKPDILINAAAKVGGIYANNSKRTEFILENLKINLNILEASIPFPNMYIINLGSSCIYPLNAENPISENSIMTGKLEPTNSPYAMAKLTAIEIGNSLTMQYNHKVLNLMPTNLYGPNDRFNEKDSHVIPGLIMRMHNAKVNNLKEFNIWGTGKPLREFLYIDDLALAIEFLIFNQPTESLLNVGSGKEISIHDLAKKLKKIIDFQGELVFDKSMPDGNPRKLLDSNKINQMGWMPTVDIDKGLETTYNWYKKNLR